MKIYKYVLRLSFFAKLSSSFSHSLRGYNSHSLMLRLFGKALAGHIPCNRRVKRKQSQAKQPQSV